MAVLTVAVALTAVSGPPAPAAPPGEADLLAAVEAGEDHLEPEELADRLMAGDDHLLLVDIRTPGEYAASLRGELLNDGQVARIQAWRAFFLGTGEAKPAKAPAAVVGALPGLVETNWLAEDLGRGDVRVIDVRAQPAYNTLHIPGSVCLRPESFRGVVGGVSSMLLPAELLAGHLSLMGIRPGDTVVLIPPDKMHDAALIAIGLERLGHRKSGILSSGFDKWLAEKCPVRTALPSFTPTKCPPRAGADRFAVDYRMVLACAQSRRALILDVCPADYSSGKKTDEARSGHMPGAINRPFSEDVKVVGGSAVFEPPDELAKAYAELIPSKDTTVVIHCRTGHHASQTYFVLKNLLGYKNILWYDAGWSEWAARPELPIEASEKPR